MSKILDIEDRLRLEQKKRAKQEKAKKIDAVRKTMQCLRCLARCARCGVQFDTQEIYKRHKGPYRLCSGCEEEFAEFLRVKEQGAQSPWYWHNKEWKALWQSWENYQQALKSYYESPEFLELLSEVEWDR